MRPCLEALEERTVPSGTVYWTGRSNPPDPKWSNSANWSSGQVPQDGDTLVFTKSESGIGWTSTVDARFTASTVTLVIDNTTFGELDLARSLTLTGNSQLSEEPGNPLTINLGGNTLTNDGALTVKPDTAALRIQILSNDHFEGGHDDNLGGALVNQGSIVQQGGDYALGDRVQIHNQAGATYDFASDGGITEGFGGQVVSNAGTVEKTGGTGTSVLGVAFSNLGGTLAADSGTLQLVNSDPLGASTGGTFNAAQGAVLYLTGGDALSTNVFSGSYTGSGQGTVLIGNGAFVVGAGGATFDFPPGLLHWGANASSFINLQGNTLTNAGFLTLVNTPGNVDDLQGEDLANDTIVGGTLINRGTIVQQGGGDLQLDDGVKLDNQVGATYDFASDGGITEGVSGQALSNAGTLEKAGGTGTSAVGVTFANTGVVRVQSGTLQFPNGLPLNGAAALTGSAAGTLSVRGDVLGNTARAAYFAPLDTVVLTGTLAGSAQLLEVMSQDRGAAARGFVNNFAYGGTLEVAAGQEVRLVDQARNSPGRAPEALYVDTLIVPATATLDLNGHHVYVRSAQVKGTVVGGSIRVLPPALTAAGQEDISATAGGAFSGAVAAVTDTFPGVTAGRLRAAITWGDGQASAGTVSANADGTFSVSGTHTYARPGSYRLSVAVLDTANKKAATAQDTATVQPADAPPLVPFFLVLRRVPAGAGVRLVAEVSFTGGLPPLDLAVPYQAPVYQHVAAALVDLDGDGIFEAVLFTARQGRWHVRKVVPV
jgi:hypothetical protein